LFKRECKFNSDPIFYPNFKKAYSVIWQIDIAQLSSDWIELAIEYYSNANAFFERNACSTYYYACPTTEKDWVKTLTEWEG